MHHDLNTAGRSQQELTTLLGKQFELDGVRSVDL